MGDETAVESVQKIFGNLVSAVMVPVAEIALRQDVVFLPKTPFEGDIRGDVVLLCGISVMTLLFFSGFDAPLKRTMADAKVKEAKEEKTKRGGIIQTKKLGIREREVTTTKVS